MPNFIYSPEERNKWVCWYYSGASFRNVRDYFAAENPKRPIPSISTIQKAIKYFQKTLCNDPRHRKVIQPKKRISEEKKVLICAAAQIHNVSITELAEQVGVCHSTVRRILQQYKYLPERVRTPEEDTKDPKDPLAFCRTMMDVIEQEPSVLKGICLERVTRDALEHHTHCDHSDDRGNNATNNVNARIELMREENDNYLVVVNERVHFDEAPDVRESNFVFIKEENEETNYDSGQERDAKRPDQTFDILDKIKKERTDD